ncbi:MAG: 3-hydroxyacyl-ACP dehydratase FabZ family protein [Alphaproteobacteria bacterium]
MRLKYFQLVDRVEELDEEKGRIECSAAVPMESTIFEGHFPDYPILPGVLLIEAMAQCSGFMLLSLESFERLPFLLQVQSAKLRTFVQPGEDLRVIGTLVHQGSGYAVTRGEVRRDGKPIADAELRFRIMAFPTENLKQRVCERAQEVGVRSAGS